MFIKITPSASRKTVAMTFHAKGVGFFPDQTGSLSLSQGWIRGRLGSLAS
jgi:hypothetical protein